MVIDHCALTYTPYCAYLVDFDLFVSRPRVGYIETDHVPETAALEL